MRHGNCLPEFGLIPRMARPGQALHHAASSTEERSQISGRFASQEDFR